MTGFEIKQSRIQTLLAEQILDTLWLSRVSSFAWATCGASSYVNTATTTGAASLLITPNARYICSRWEQIRSRLWIRVHAASDWYPAYHRVVQNKSGQIERRQE